MKFMGKGDDGLNGRWRALLLVVFICHAQGVVWAADPPAKEEPQYRLNWPNPNLEMMIKVYADLTRRIAIRAGNLPIQTRIPIEEYKGMAPLMKEDAITAVQNVLAINGFTIVHQGEKFFKVIQSSPTARLEGVPISLEDGKLAPSDQLVSRLVQLKYVDATEMVQSMTPSVKHANGAITPFPRTNSLLITDRAANVIEMLKVIDHVDQSISAEVQTKFYRLKNAKAKDVVERIRELLAESLGASSKGVGQGGKTAGTLKGAKQGDKPKKEGEVGAEEGPEPAGVSRGQRELTFSEESILVGKATFSADERTNQIILLTRVVNFPFFNHMIERLDADTADPVLLKTIPLKYSDAGELAGLLNQVLGNSAEAARPRERISSSGSGASSQPQPGAAPAGGAAGAGGKKEEGEVSVYPDLRMNWLIAMGTAQEIGWVEKFVKEEDVPLPQVLLEGIVAEVTLDRSDTFGIEVLARATSGEISHSGLVNTLAANPVSAATIGPASLPTVLADGFNYWGSLNESRIDIILQALSKKSNVKILSQPHIQASHNQEAEISVGEKRPVVTQSTSTPITSGTTTTTASVSSQVQLTPIELKLHIRPLINPEARMVQLDIQQTADALTGFQKIDGNDVPIISTRSATSVVSVKDGEMIILGGLIKNTESVAKTGIPILSDIPLIGSLFSTTTKGNIRTELVLLLKPTVLNSPEEASAEAKRRLRDQYELYKRRDIKEMILSEPSVAERIDQIAQPPSVPAEPVDMDQDLEPEQKPQTEFKADPDLRPE